MLEIELILVAIRLCRPISFLINKNVHSFLLLWLDPPPPSISYWWGVQKEVDHTLSYPQGAHPGAKCHKKETDPYNISLPPLLIERLLGNSGYWWCLGGWGNKYYESKKEGLPHMQLISSKCLPYCTLEEIYIYSLLCRLKINYMTEFRNMCLFLARWTLRLLEDRKLVWLQSRN